MSRACMIALLLGGNLATAEPARTTVTIGSPTVKGKLDPKVVRTAVARSSQKLIDCYLRSPPPLGHDPLPPSARFTIQATGTVTDVAMSAMPSPQETCIAAVISKLVFGKRANRAPVTVVLPLTFTSGDDIEDTDRGGDQAMPDSGWGPGFRHWDGAKPLEPAPASTLSFGALTVQGSLAPETVRRYLKRSAAQLRYCYERALSKVSTLEGTVTAKLTITSKGLVTNATAAGLGADVEKCVAGVLENLELPAPAKGTVAVTASFTFGRPTAGAK